MKDRIKIPAKPERPNLGMWRFALWILIVWVSFSFFTRLYGPSGPRSHDIAYSEFKKSVQKGNVAEIVVKGDRISGTYDAPVKKPPPGVRPESQEKKEAGDREKGGGGDHPKMLEYGAFRTVAPAFDDPELMKLLERNQVVVRAESEKTSTFWVVVANLLPWVLILGLIVWSGKKFQKRMGPMGKKGGIFGFGKSKAQVYSRETAEVSYDDVAGLKNAKMELREIVEFLKDPARFQRLGGELPKGVLLVGKPGVGKTLLAKSTAGEAEVPFFSISGSEFIEMFVGVGASRVRDMFEKAKKDAPSIIFIDEIDSIGRARGAGLGGGHDEREQTLNQILAEMDGFVARESVVVLAATNRPDVLDPALVRPGRFDRRIVLDAPRKKARKEILAIHARDVPVEDDVDFGKVAAMTVGFTGADLKNLVNEAALLAARKKREQVEPEDFEQARDKILMGLEREDFIGDDEKKTIAYHEAGHALMALLLPKADPPRKVTIIPRGRALGVTEQLPDEDRLNLGRQRLLSTVAVMLGGRAAEIVEFGDVTSGAADDLKRATRLARRMVCQWGMSDKIGPASFEIGETNPFLGKDISGPKDHSEHTARIIDEEIRNIVAEMEKTAVSALRDKKERLDRLADSLLENETLSSAEIEDITGPFEPDDIRLPDFGAKEEAA